MQFYFWESPLWDDAGHTKYAEYYDDNGDLDRERTEYTCPLCGQKLGPYFWKHPRKLTITTSKYADLLYGPLTMVVSERFKQAYEASGLTGISAFGEIEAYKVQRRKKNDPPPGKYYTMSVVPAEVYLDLENSRIDYLDGEPDEDEEPDEPICPLCTPVNKSYCQIHRLALNTDKWNGEDLFHVPAMGGHLFASERFVQFIRDHQLTNFWFSKVEEYKFTFEFDHSMVFTPFDPK